MAREEAHADTSPSPPPLPGPPPLTQGWHDAVFVHWSVAPDQVAPLLPAHTRPDALEGHQSHMGLVAFQVPTTTDAGAVPLGSFNEVSVRMDSEEGPGRQGAWSSCP